MRPKGNAEELERRRRRAVKLMQEGEAPTLIVRIVAILVPTAVCPGVPNRTIRAGVIRNPPPIPSMPVRSPTNRAIKKPPGANVSKPCMFSPNDSPFSPGFGNQLILNTKA